MDFFTDLFLLAVFVIISTAFLGSIASFIARLFFKKSNQGVQFGDKSKKGWRRLER